MTNRLVIMDGRIVTMDEARAPVVGDMLIEDGRVVAVGGDLGEVDADRIDAAGSIVMPGLIDCHRHVWQLPLRSLTADWSLMNYLLGIRVRAAALFTADDMYVAQLAGALEMLNAGVTTVVDYCHNILTPDHAWESIRGLRESGIRAVWAAGFNVPPEADDSFGDHVGKAAFLREVASKEFSSKDDRLTLGCAPEELGLATADTVAAQYRFAREVGALITHHVNTTRWGGDPAEVANVLAPRQLLGPDVLLVHVNITTTDEWKLIADSGTHVVFTPETEMQMGMGYPSTERARSVGIRPSLGADIVSNNSGDMFFPLRLALQVERAAANQRGIDGCEVQDGVSVGAGEALAWATVNGAAAAGLASRVGRLAPGMAADVVVLDASTIEMSGWAGNDAPAHVALQA
nr:amidohydrolase family protein [Actinomycetota bacterium]